MRPLILSGGPAVGKSTCARALSAGRVRAACIDVDDLRQLVVAGAATLWTGEEGVDQLLLSARNAAALARNFLANGFDVVIADFVTPESLMTYRHQLPECFVVHLHISVEGARERAATRRVYLSKDEFDLLHRMVVTPPAANLIIDVEGLAPEEQLNAIRSAWERAG